MKKDRSPNSNKKRVRKPTSEGSVVLNQILPNTDHDDVAVQIMRMVSTVRIGVKDGEMGALQNAVFAAQSFAEEIKRAYIMHPSILKEITQNLDVLSVPISPRVVTSDEHGERKVVRAFLKNCAVGTKSIQPTGRKTQSVTLWSALAQKALHQITIAKGATAQSSHPFIKELLARERNKKGTLISKVEGLPPFSKQTLPRWWQVAKDVICSYWEARPEEFEQATSKARSDAGRSDVESEKAFAIRKIREAFVALLPNQG